MLSVNLVISFAEKSYEPSWSDTRKPGLMEWLP